ncbi:MAG: hypothetical protein NZL93_03980, partial [Chthoniobacterales bacterium]|nr:hypothetical protein [Chthoniobacterales bacterium]
AIARKLADAMSRYMQLPPFLYKNPKVARLSEDGYIWGRNLLATRLYECPVIFAEPYVMNNIETFARIQAGDYEGLRVVGGMRRPSIYREYAEAVVQGLINYYKR